MKKDKKRNVILLPRSIVNQVWYRDKCAFAVYLYLLLDGGNLYSLQALGDGTGLTCQQTIAALKRLETAGIVTVSPQRKGLLIVVHEVR